MDIDCKCGKSFTSRVLGGRTSCPKCKKSYYIRKDGTTGPRSTDSTPATKSTPAPTTPGTRRPTRKVTRVAYATSPPADPNEPNDTEEPHESAEGGRAAPAKRAAPRVQRTNPRVRKRTGSTATPAAESQQQPRSGGKSPGQRGTSQGKPRRSGPYDSLFGW